MVPHRKDNRTSLAFALTRAVPALLLTLAAGGLAFLLLAWAAHQSDRVSFQRQEKLVGLVVSQLRAQIAHDQESSTVWDTSVEKVRADDTHWIDDNLGTWMHSYFGFDGAYVLNPENRPIYAFANGGMTSPAAYDGIRRQVALLVHALRRDMRGGHGTGPGGKFLSPGLADLAVVRGHPAVISVKPIVTDTGKIRQAPGSEYLHVAVRFLDGSFARRLTHDYLFNDLHFAWTPAHGPGAAAYPVDDNAGRRIGYFIWRPYRPGTAVLSRALPVLGGLLALALLTVSGFLAVVRSRSLRLQASEMRIRHLAFHDPLTGLPNRTFFSESVDAALAGSGGAPTALLFLDLDRFKQVNDTLGHPAGDMLIREFATRLRALVREGDIVARVGGDEFTIMLAGVAGRDDVEKLCARIVESVRMPFDLDGNRLFIGLSLGVALAPDDGTDRIDLLRKADIALYSVKATGRGRYAFFEPGMDDALRLRRDIEADLRAALQEEGEIVPHYQPIHAAAGHAITGFEALLRWHHPTRGWISPEVFIPIAEDAGLIEMIGERVLSQACAAAVNWPNRTIAVNASGVELASPAYAGRVAAILRATGLPPQRLEIEITETAANGQIGTAAETLAALRALGVRIAIDDFGTGFSSLARLRQLRVDRVKIDRGFIHGFGNQDSDEVIVQAIIDLAHAKGLRVTAEGVETPQQREGLARIGCDDLQGFIFSKARPALEIDRLVGDEDGVPANDMPAPQGRTA